MVNLTQSDACFMVNLIQSLMAGSMARLTQNLMTGFMTTRFQSLVAREQIVSGSDLIFNDRLQHR